MIKDLMAASAPLNMEIFGLLIFTVIFSVICLWTFRKSGKRIYANLADMPISEKGRDHE